MFIKKFVYAPNAYHLAAEAYLKPEDVQARLKLKRSKSYEVFKSGEFVYLGKALRISEQEFIHVLSEKLAEINIEYSDEIQFFTVPEIAAHLNFSENNIYKLISEEEILAIRFGRIIRVPDVSVQNYLNRQKSKHKSQSGYNQGQDFNNSGKTGVVGFSNKKGENNHVHA